MNVGMLAYFVLGIIAALCLGLLCENTELLSTDVSVPDVYVKGTKR